MLERRLVDICCVQETRWKGSGLQWIVGKNERYRFFWQGDKNKRAIGGVGVLVAEKLESSVIEINRVNGRLMVIKEKLGKTTINVLSAYKQYLNPFESPNLLFFAAWPMLAACFALYSLRKLDTLLAIEK